MFGVYLAGMLSGCSHPRPDVSGATFTVWDESRSTQLTYELTPEGQHILEELLARKPDRDHSGSVGLEPSGIIRLEGWKILLEPDQIFLVGGNRTRIWNQNNIRDDLILNSLPVHESQDSENGNEWRKSLTDLTS